MDARHLESLHSHVHFDERVIWIGKPSPGLKALPLAAGLLCLLPLAIVLLLTLLDGVHPFEIFVAFLALIGINTFVMAVRDSRTRRNTVYALTTHRALRLIQDQLESVPINDLYDIVYVDRRNGTGTIYCRARGIGNWPRRNPKGERRSLFRMIVDVRCVHELLREVQGQPISRLPGTRQSLESRIPTR